MHLSANEISKAPLIDQHLSKLAIYVKFNSVVAQIVLDFALGLGFLTLTYLYPDFFISAV